jgi:predicted pyridoxine 5'-phosphate oxidase superfamily flavin-nucleotide-binding protein
MGELINNALAEGCPCLIATASKDAVPELGYKGSMMVFDKESLAFWERTFQTTIRNIQENPRVMVLYRNAAKGGAAWRFLGTATVYKDGAIREQVMSRTVQAELDKDPERKGYAVVIRVDKIFGIGPKLLMER